MKRLRRILLLSTLVFTAVVAVTGGWIFSLYSTPTANTESVRVDIEPGMSFRAATRHLADAGIYPHPEFLYYWARLTDQTALRAGEYDIPPARSIDQLLTLLGSGRTVRYRVTFAEGRDFAQWRSVLAAQEKLVQTLPDMSDAEVASWLGVDQPVPEGWLFPSTYYYHRGMTDREILRQAYTLMQSELEEAWQARSDRTPVETPYEALILASIIERETGAAWERPEIAGVFARRLERGMRLQTDPTVIYGMGDRYEGRLSRQDLETPTPYNTYEIEGLPPTPIAMPGRGAIEAALNPAEGTALYFVARGDGTHVFSDTLREHNRAVREYQLQRRQDYRSSPPVLPAPETPEDRGAPEND